MCIRKCTRRLRFSDRLAYRYSKQTLSVCCCTEYPQEGIDAAVRDFAALAGDANAELLAAFVAKALQQASEDAAYVRSGARSVPFACYACHPAWRSTS